MIVTLDNARTLFEQGKLDDAAAVCGQLIARNPSDADAWHLSAQVALRQRNYDEAAVQIISAQMLRADPAFAQTRRRIDRAMGLEQAQSLKQLGRYSEAIGVLTARLQAAPDDDAALNNLGDLQMTCGRVDQAIPLLRRAAYGEPASMLSHSHLLLAMTHSDHVGADELFQEHLEWGRRYTPTNAPPPPKIDPPDPRRQIRVGYVSPDLREHPVGHFIEPVLAAHDRDQFQITLYNDHSAGDVVTERMKATGHRWTDSFGMSFEQLFERIRDDRIDILIDLAVHTAGNRLPLFAARAAPIQMTWLGYAGTTGCAAVDYRITDSVVDPPGMNDRFFTEKLLRLPEVLWCYGQPADAAPAPREGGAIRFGAATRLAKISDSCLQTWCDLLRQVPEAGFTLAAEAFADRTIRDEWTAKFTSRGVDASRLSLLSGQAIGQYKSLLGSFDIGLDTIPFNGGTTLCNMLWMGTPAVALAGTSSVSRVSMSILHAIGLDELVAASPAEWVRSNLDLARNPQRLAELRRRLRRRIGDCALGDAKRFTRGLEGALRQSFVDAISRKEGQ